MAEMPMAPTDDSPMPGEAAPTQPGAGGTVIEILCKPDGSYEVSSEPAEAEMGEGEGGEPKGQKAATAGEALKLVLGLMKQAAPSAGGDTSPDFEAGYAG